MDIAWEALEDRLFVVENEQDFEKKIIWRSWGCFLMLGFGLCHVPAIISN